MPNVIESVAEALLAEVAAQSWTLDFTSEWSYADWELPLEEVSALRLDVVPWPELPVDLDDRNSLSNEVSLDLVLRQRFGGQALDQEKEGRVKRDLVTARVAQLLDLNRYFTKDRFATFDSAVWTGTRIKTLYLPSHLRTKQQYTGIVRLTFESNEE